MDLIRQVWSHNLYQELAILNVYLSRFSVIVIDTEFPDFIRSTPRGAPEEHLYQDLKFNLNLLKILQLMVIKSMMESVVEFAIIAQRFLGTVSDLKYMIRNCEYLLNGELGLKKLTKLLNIVNDIPTHQLAGFDSLLIAFAYAKMKKMYEFSSENLDGFLYGLYYRIRGHKIHWFNPYYLHWACFAHSLFCGYVIV
ncbi:poly(A) ribonuclease pop2-like [Benincasa hispida]|uniref:poly(A) ribonuclease pop2-like n=1 Tax=Benincasa hispida TaxID=102211 RepID=UPI001902B6BC|nr:poly(A) ribonuclease pop2-like [Benincasa hispida]